jgi:hypothetical protein
VAEGGDDDKDEEEDDNDEDEEETMSFHRRVGVVGRPAIMDDNTNGGAFNGREKLNRCIANGSYFNGAINDGAASEELESSATGIPCTGGPRTRFNAALIIRPRSASSNASSSWVTCDGDDGDNGRDEDEEVEERLVVEEDSEVFRLADTRRGVKATTICSPLFSPLPPLFASLLELEGLSSLSSTATSPSTSSSSSLETSPSINSPPPGNEGARAINSGGGESDVVNDVRGGKSMPSFAPATAPPSTLPSARPHPGRVKISCVYCIIDVRATDQRSRHTRGNGYLENTIGKLISLSTSNNTLEYEIK